MLNDWYKILSNVITREELTSIILEDLNFSDAKVIKTYVYKERNITKITYASLNTVDIHITIVVRQNYAFYDIGITSSNCIAYGKEFNNIQLVFDELDNIKRVILEEIKKLKDVYPDCFR